MKRFHCIKDKSDQQEDLRLAKHITYVHEHSKEPPTGITPLDMHVMRKYIIACRKKNPTIPESLSDRLVQAYVELRADTRNINYLDNPKSMKDTTFTSPRSLLAILRLSTALVRTPKTFLFFCNSRIVNYLYFRLGLDWQMR